MRIGIDFDNTIVNYDHVFSTEARARGLIDNGFTGAKTEIRDHIQSLDDGELEWQRLQGRVYGALMAEARLIEGVGDFLNQSREKDHETFIVSHKTQFGHHDPERVDLRQTAMTWMETCGFFDGGYGLKPESVFFEPTRKEKVARIEALGCSHFIDDLIEVFNEPDFPDGVEKLLFHPGAEAPEGPYKAFATWQEITDDVFGDDG